MTTAQAAASDDLLELATAHGVATQYWDWQQRHVVVPAATVIAVLAGLGIDAAPPPPYAPRSPRPAPTPGDGCCPPPW